MFISGFTIVRNGIKFDYPFIEAILSIHDLCDEVVVLVGNSEDETRKKIEDIGSPKIKIFDSTWNDSLREGGKVLSLETNKAFGKISPQADWAFYIQGDEVIHEKDLPVIKTAMKKHLSNPDVEGLLFKYHHFYGAYDYLGDSRKWYRNEIRVIRNDKQISSYRDAQGFRKKNNKLQVKPVNATIYHYGWVKHPQKQQLKQQSFHKMWHDDIWMKKNVGAAPVFDYSKIDSLQKFKGSHPEIMCERIANQNWNMDFDLLKKTLSPKDRILYHLEKLTGYRIGEYKNYRII